MQKNFQFTVELEFAGYTVYEYLIKHLPEYPASIVKKMFHNELVKVNKESVASTTRLQTDDEIKIRIPSHGEGDYKPEAPSMDIIFENDDFLVVNKPSGIPVIPERWSHQHLFKDGVCRHLEESGQKICEPRVVHRIDKEASGAVLVAKTQQAEQYLCSLFEKRAIYKEYLALVAGIPPDQGRIDQPIAQASNHSNRMIISAFGKSAITNYELLEPFRDFALLKVRIETGRTHQIRVHLASQGYPLAIDPIYGFRNSLKLSEIKPGYRPKKGQEEKPLISRLTLHAFKISFSFPKQETPFVLEAPLPEDFELILKMLRKYRSQGIVQSAGI